MRPSRYFRDVLMEAGFSPGRDSQEPRQNIRTTPDIRATLVAECSERFLSLISHGTGRSSRLENYLHQLCDVLSPTEQTLVVNAIHPSSLQGASYFLASQQQLFSTSNLSLLLKMGLDLERTFPINTGSRHEPQKIADANIYHCAAMYGRSDLLAALPINPKLQNAPTASGETPAIFAIKYAHDVHHAERGLTALYAKGINLEARDNDQRQIFHYALRFRQDTILNRLKEYWKIEDLKPVTSEEIASAVAFTVINAAEKGFKVARRRLELLTSLPCSPHAEEARVAGLEKALMRYLDDDFPSQVRAVRVMFSRLLERRELLGEKLLADLMNLPASNDGKTFFTRLCAETCSGRLAVAALKLGADRSHNYALHHDPAFSGTFMHDAALSGDFDFVDELLDWNPSFASLIDNAGNTPLMSCLTASAAQEEFQASHQLLRLLAQHQNDLSHTNHDNFSSVDLALKAGDLSSLLDLLRRGATIPDQERFKTYENLSYPIPLSFRELAFETQALLAAIVREQGTDERSQEIRTEARQLLKHTRSVYQTYLYLNACQEALEDGATGQMRTPSGKPLQLLSQSALFHPPPSRLSALWRLIEQASDSAQMAELPLRGTHPNEAEMLLLLNSPRSERLQSDQLNPLTRALTSVTRFIDADIREISGRIVWNFARLGLYTHGFHQTLRYDTQSEKKYSAAHGWVKSGASLLEKQLGFFPISQDSPLSRTFGSSFIYINGESSRITPTILHSRSGDLRTYTYDPRTVMVCAQGIAAVYHPTWGTLIIRNSSPTFGRDLLRHAAYWSPPSGDDDFELQDLTELTPSMIEDLCIPVLDPELYTHQHHLSDPTEAIYQLLRQLDVFRDHRRRNIFDTNSHTAFTRQDGKSVLCERGGYRSPLFAERVSFLEQRYEAVQQEIRHTGRSSVDVPELIFCRPFYPAWTGFRFEVADQFQSRLTINREVLQVLRAFADGQFTRQTSELAQSTGVLAFFQEAGFYNHGELVMVHAREPKGRPNSRISQKPD